MRRRPQEDFEFAIALIEAGLGDSEIARSTGIPRGTISAWRHGRGIKYHMRLAEARPSWRPPCQDQYAYVLDLYLGDGCIQMSSRGFPRIFITLDASYPGIVEQAERALSACFPDASVNRFARTEGA
jgi:hypothetical protein